MKKFIFVLFAVITMAASANAQVYIGGTAGVVSFSKDNYTGDNDDETAFRILPEIGYKINSNWAVGGVIGYEKGSLSLLGQSQMTSKDMKAFSIAPYARWTFVHSKYVNGFLDLGFGFMSGSIDDGDFTAWNIGAKPGIEVNLSKHISFVTKLGFLGYEEFNPDGDNNNSSSFGFNVSGNNIEFGVYYNF